MKKILFSFLCLFCSSSVLAARVGQVIVDQAPVYEYPQFSSKVISKVKRGESIAVSNLATEGFYKARVKSGEVGWVSGNDILVGSAQEAANTVLPSAPKKGPKKGQFSYLQEAEAASEAEEADNDERYRFLFGYGLESLSYSGLGKAFEGTSTLNYGSNFGAELQWRSTENLFWAARIEALYTGTGAQLVSNGNTQTMSQFLLPVQFGAVYSLIDANRFRLAAGGYIGFSFISSMTVEQVPPTTGTGASNKYSTIDPCATAALQMSYGLSQGFWIFGELDYRYEKTGVFASAPLADTANPIPAFAIDYSGIVSRFGVEFKF